MTFTTATSPRPKSFLQNRLLQVLSAVYAAVWVWAAIAPNFRKDWVLENILVVVGVGLAVWICRTRPLSDLSNILCAVFLVLHTVGAHYTYALVPAGEWLKHAAGLERNHYDRIIHFSFGLLIVYPLREYLMRRDVLRGGWLSLLAFAIIATCSGFYELMEWAAAVIVDPKAGAAFLGTQGDPFDSQQDQFVAFCGAILTLVVVHFTERKRARTHA